MGQKKMQMAEKSCALTLLEKGDSVLAVTRNIYQLKREAIYQLKRSAALLPPRMVLKRKSGSGAPEKTLPRIDKLLNREVTSYLSIAVVEQKTSTESFSTMSQP